MSEQVDKLKAPAKRNVTLLIIILAIIWSIIGFVGNFCWHFDSDVSFLWTLFNFMPVVALMWLIDQQEKHNVVVKNWILLLGAVVVIALMLTSPMKPLLVII